MFITITRRQIVAAVAALALAVTGGVGMSLSRAAVTAAAGGTVKETGFDADRGNYLILDHGNGMETVYAHCLSLAVEAEDVVEADEEIAAVGSTGKSTGPHLHFEVRQDGEAQNPIAYFDREIRDTLKMG